MYVIQVSGATAQANIGKAANFDVMLPADRCTFRTTIDNDSSGYVINEVTFWPGHAAGIAVPATNVTFDIRLGFIGKSGRFVPMTDSNNVTG